MPFKTIPIAAALLCLAVVGAQSARGATLVFCSEASPENFNPMLSSSNTTFAANLPVYGRLVEFKPGTVEVQPGLAEAWDVSPDGKSYTFHLRRGVHWHRNRTFVPSRGINADDIVFSFERQWRETNPYHHVSGGTYAYFGDMGLDKLITGIERVDDLTVRFTLAEPRAPFLADLAMDFAAIQSKEYADALLQQGHPELIDQQPIGTGPFEFVNYQRDTVIRYRAFKDFWGEAPKVDLLVFSINKDPAVRMAKLRANECQMMAFPRVADLDGIRHDPKLALQQQAGLNIGYLAFNTRKPPFDDQRVREALDLAIDRKAILRAVFQGAGEAANGLLPPTMWSYDAGQAPFPHDPARAKQMLADAGFSGGFETTLWAMPVQRPYNPDARRMAELIQDDLAKVGVRVRIVSFEWGEYRKRLQNGEHDMALFGWTGDNGDPDNFFAPILGCAAARTSGSNIARWCDPVLDGLIGRAAVQTGQDLRAPLYRDAQARVRGTTPLALIAHSTVFVPMRREVSGFLMSPLGRFQFDNVSLQ